MFQKLKSKMQESRTCVATYRVLKNALVYPLQFTSFKTLQPHKVPLRDFFDRKKTWLIAAVKPYTKNGYRRLANVYDLAMDIEKRNVPGAFIECGVYKGGCCAIMGAVANRYGNRRKTWYLDSFEGMPKTPSPFDGSGTDEIAGDVLLASEKDVEELVFEKLRLPRESNIIVKGWFEEVLPRIKQEIGPIALLRLDADWYEATVLILNELYDQIVPGGYLIFDDYARWEGCKKAVDDFLKQRNLQPEIHFIGRTHGAFASPLAPMYFQKQ